MTRLLSLRFLDDGKKTIVLLDQLESELKDPPGSYDDKLLDRIQGCMFGLALGDAVGAHVEFRPYAYMLEHPVKDLVGGGTWGLKEGQVCPK